MASSVIKRITDTAEKLYDLRQVISAKEEENKKELEALKGERDAIQATLIADLNKNGLASIKVKSGDTFSKSIRKGVEITNEIVAMKWAIERRLVSINKVLVAQELKTVETMPDGFKLVENEYISVRKAKNDKEI